MNFIIYKHQRDNNKIICNGFVYNTNNIKQQKKFGGVSSEHARVCVIENVIFAVLTKHNHE